MMLDRSAEGEYHMRMLRCTVAVAAMTCPVYADWHMLQKDYQHTGRSTYSVVPSNTARWVWVSENHVTRPFTSASNQYINYPSPREVILAGDVQPIVAENRVYFGATNGEFYALNGADASTAWKKQLGGAVLHTAAYADGTVVCACMDGKVYAWVAATGNPRWTFAGATAGYSVAPIIVNGVVLAGNRDGWFYAVNLADGSLRWKYRTIADVSTSPFSGAPIMQSAASDGTRVFFGAENTYFYALSVDNGTELWRRRLGGSGFQYTWPVVSTGIVMTFVNVPYGLSEYVMENELDSLPAKNTGESALAYYNRIWPQERQVIRTWLANNPDYENFFVMRTDDGQSPYAERVPMGRVGGIGYPNRAPVIDNQGRILMYWRVRSSVFLTGGTFGSKYTPDISAMNPATGDRIALPVTKSDGVELDNTFTMTVGGNYLYWNNHMRGSRCLNLTNTDGGIRMTQPLAYYDWGDFRGWGTRLIWLGNDSNRTYLPPVSRHRSPQGDCGVVIAVLNGRPTLIIQESGHYQINFGCIAAAE